VGKLDIELGLTASGPIADGLAEGMIRDWIGEVTEDIAQEGVNRLQHWVMDKTGRGTGHYQAEIVISDLFYGDKLIHDPVVYGPWLEGTSERNRSTRFKGYHLWRETKRTLNDDAASIAEKRLPELEAKLNGGFRVA
jgi:hypothetical protein